MTGNPNFYRNSILFRSAEGKPFNLPNRNLAISRELNLGRTVRLMNVTDLAAPFQLSRPTIRDYVTLLERAGHAAAVTQQSDEPPGEATVPFGDDLHAVPIRMLWETSDDTLQDNLES